MTILIGITGKFGCGKSEVCNIIKNISGLNAVGIIKFADPIYELSKMIYEHLGIHNKKDRKLLQFIGTDWGRKRDVNMWVDIFSKNLETMKGFYNVLICDDLRFLNEYNFLKKEGFNLVKIERPLNNIEFINGGDLSHESEFRLDTIEKENYDYYLENNSSYDDFVYLVSEMFLDIKEK